MTIPAIGGWTATATAAPASSTPRIDDAFPVAPDDAVTKSAASGFADLISQGLSSVQEAQSTSSELAIQAATGDLTDVHDYMIASARASLATELTVAVRNKAVEAFNDIMRMPV